MDCCTRKFVILPALVLSTFFIQGCNSYRMMPSHGGGKRFDEEQRAVASAARKAVADMNVQELFGRKISTTVESLGQSGGGSAQFPGLTSASAGYNTNNYNYQAPYIVSQQENMNFSLSYNPNVLAYPTVFSTDQDLRYLDACLQMKLRHQGIVTPASDAEYMLYVLVDVFGTNRSKQDSIIAWDDTLSATCELTYYAINLKNNKLLFKARRSSAQATYEERSVFGFAAYHIERKLDKIEPSPMPVDSNDRAGYPITVVVKDKSKLFPRLKQTGIKKPKISPAVPKPPALDQKLQEADSYIQAGNFDAAQRIILEISSQAPQYPGLDGVNARLEQAKAAQMNKSQHPEPGNK